MRVTRGSAPGSNVRPKKAANRRLIETCSTNHNVLTCAASDELYTSATASTPATPASATQRARVRQQTATTPASGGNRASATEAGGGSRPLDPRNASVRKTAPVSAAVITARELTWSGARRRVGRGFRATKRCGRCLHH